jgi:PAS domain S-box-containing protein
MPRTFNTVEPLLESVGDGLVAVDRSGAITRLSARAEALTGMPAAAARGRHVSEVVRIIDAEDHSVLDDLVARALNGDSVARSPGIRAVIVGNDGGEHAIIDAAVPLRDASGAIDGALLVLRDVGAERASEEERFQLQAQLVVSERMSSMGTLSGGIAHEINNPLSSVLANLTLLEQELPKVLSNSPHSAELLEAVAEAHRGADRVAQIVRGLKVFSRGLDDRRQPLDVAQVAENVLQLVANELRHRARVVREFYPAPHVEASESHIGQVLVNLLLNAAQSLPEGEADRNEVRIVIRPHGAAEVVLEVRDTGAGMPPEVLARVFDPFFTTRPIGSGPGLGLSICHGIITSLNGRIEAESTVGRGSTFRVTLPACAHEPVEAEPRPPRTPRRARILLVEDDALVARAVRRTLGRDHEVVFVEGGREAVKALENETFDLVISDVMMPHMTGMDLHAELQRTHPEMARRMVFLSGGAFTDAAKEFLRRVPNAQVDKPFDPQALRDLVARLLAG